MMPERSFLRRWGWSMNDNIYCYPESNVLINNFDIRNQEQLNILERKLTMLRIMDLINTPIGGSFDLEHLCRIHQYIFQDLYLWAGELRTVEIAKGNMFCRWEYIKDVAKQIFNDIAMDVSLGVFQSEVAPKRFAYHFAEVNALHPFREGNGRAQREFIRELALSQGFLIEFSRVSAEDMLDASKASFLCNYVPMEQIFEKCLVKR